MATDVSTAPIPSEHEHLHGDHASHQLPNGDHAHHLPQDAPTANQDVFDDNNSRHMTIINVKSTTQPDPNPAGPTPVEDVVDGIEPVSEFIPKDAPVHNHPTPPPDQPLTTGEADVDVAMTNAAEPERILNSTLAASLQPTLSTETSAPQESSLVRPREDDDEEDEERMVKRTRVDDAVVSDAAATISESTQDVAMQDEPSAPSATAPEADIAVVETLTDAAAEVPASASNVPTDGQPTNSILDGTSEQRPEGAAQPQPSTEQSSAAPALVSEPEQATETSFSTTPLTKAQRDFLTEKVKNLKKTKHSSAFLKPVDPVALNIPSYFDIVKEPMDISTMEHKLKSDQYGSVQAFVDDFNKIIHNTRLFNGDAHVVTQAGMSMKAYFDRIMEHVPGPDVAAPVKAVKAEKEKRRASADKAPSRRESRQVTSSVPSAVAAAPPAETFALADGQPQIRRANTDRPARAIKPPANREIPYAKPKRKAHQVELKFCEHVLEELRSPKYAPINQVFAFPVDPVALNIPHYRQVIKEPMDLSTMSQKLKLGQYEKASEFRKDFDLMIQNCLKFNPLGNPVHDMGIQFDRYFATLWATKEKWERAHKQETARATSASGDEESGAEEEEDDDEPEDDKEQTIAMLQKQLADMQSMVQGLTSGGAKPGKVKKSKEHKSSSKRSSNIGSISSKPAKTKASAPATKKKTTGRPARLVTYEEKQEISEAVGEMDEVQLNKVTEIITTHSERHRNMEEMELEIDELPNEVQHMLLKYVRQQFGKSKGASTMPLSPPDDGEIEDDDFEPSERVARGAGAQRRSKHKPMGKREQQETIQHLNSKLEQFKQIGTSGSESPTGGSSFQAKAESSGDEESEESEEE